MDWQATLENYTQLAIDTLPGILGKVAAALLTVIIGLWIVKRLIKLLNHVLERSPLGPELAGFFVSMASIAMKFIVVLAAASFFGFEAASILGVLAGVVFAIGLALQGFLGNFASGITIVFFKPYKVGDWVQISEHFGKVESIQIFNTTLVTPGEKTLIIPNGKVTDDIITNYSTKGSIRLELSITMPYEESFPKVKKVIEETLDGYSKILHDPAPIIGIDSFDSHNIIITIRPFIHPDDFWQVTFELNSLIKEAFHNAGIKVAYSEGVELGSIGN